MRYYVNISLDRSQHMRTARHSIRTHHRGLTAPTRPSVWVTQLCPLERTAPEVTRARRGMGSGRPVPKGQAQMSPTPLCHSPQTPTQAPARTGPGDN